MLPSLTKLALDEHGGRNATVASVGVISVPPKGTPARQKGLARVVALLEEDLIREAEAAYGDWGRATGHAFQPAERWLSAPAARVLHALRASGLSLSLDRADGALLVGDQALGLLEAQIREWTSVPEVLTMAKEQMEDGGSSREPAFVAKHDNLDGTLLTLFKLLLDDTVAQSIEFQHELPNSKHRQWHSDLDTATDTHQISFWNVVTLDMFNTVAVSRRRDGYEEELKQEFPFPFVLAARPKIGLGAFFRQNQPASSFLVYDDLDPRFDAARINQAPNTMSRWPRVKVPLLVSAHATNLMAVSPTRLVDYDDCVLAFHGTTRRSAVSIDQGFDFHAAARQQLGPGFYVSTNFNESKTYSLQHLASMQKRDNYQRPEDPNAPHKDLEVAVVCVILIQQAHTIRRVPIGVPQVVSSSARSFVLNPNPAAGQQVCLHGGVEPLMRLVAVHDIDARGEIFSTGIYDTAHDQASGTPGGPKRGVLAAA